MSKLQPSGASLRAKVEASFAGLGQALRELYGLLRSDRAARSLVGDLSAMYNRCLLEERLLRTRLGMNPVATAALPDEPVHATDLLRASKGVAEAAIADCRDLEDYFGFFGLAGVAEFYRKVRFELLDLLQASQHLLTPEEPELYARGRRRPEEAPARSVIVDGRVRRALLACPLYFILDSSLAAQRDAVKLGYEVVNAGVRLLQLRLEGFSTREFIDTAQRLKPICAERDCLLIVNNRLDVALLSGADGIHVGQGDPTIAEVRKCAPALLVGATVRKTKTALEAQQAGADYLGCGSVYPSATKPGLPLLGTRGIRRIAQSVGIPVVGIGGVTVENAAEVLEAGADGVCSVAPFRQLRSTRNLIASFRQLQPGHR